jgi:hypothetical protein
MTGAPAPAGRVERRAAIADWLVPAAIILLAVALRLRRFDYFLVPDTDFWDLRAVGIALLHGQPPPLYLRPPLSSLLMAVFAPLFHGHDPVLLAAESVNLVMFAVGTFLLYRLARIFVGTAAWVVALLFAFDALGFHMTLQPRAELAAVTWVILGSYLATRGPVGGYVAAALASLTRWEGAFLIPALFLRDLVYGPHRWRAFLYSAAASVPLFVWLMLSFRHTGHLNPYFEYSGGTTTAAGGAFMTVLARTCLGSIGLAPQGPGFALAALLFGGLVVGGLWCLWRTSPRDALPIISFFGLTLGLNLVFFSATAEHAFMIVWVCQLAVVAAVVGFTRVAAPALPPAPEGPGSTIRAVLGAAVLLALALLLWAARRNGSTMPTEPLALSLLIIGAILATTRPRSVAGAVLVGAGIILVPVAARRDLDAVNARLRGVAFVKGELRRAGEWFATHAGPKERMAVVEPWVVAAYAEPRSIADLVDSRNLTAQSPDQLAADLRHLGADYVVWNSQHGNLDPGDYYFRKYRIDLLRQLGDGRSTPDFEVLDTLRAGPTYAYVYRVRR